MSKPPLREYVCPYCEQPGRPAAWSAGTLACAACGAHAWPEGNGEADPPADLKITVSREGSKLRIRLTTPPLELLADRHGTSINGQGGITAVYVQAQVPIVVGETKTRRLTAKRGNEEIRLVDETPLASTLGLMYAARMLASHLNLSRTQRWRDVPDESAAFVCSTCGYGDAKRWWKKDQTPFCPICRRVHWQDEISEGRCRSVRVARSSQAVTWAYGVNSIDVCIRGLGAVYTLGLICLTPILLWQRSLRPQGYITGPLEWLVLTFLLLYTLLMAAGATSRCKLQLNARELRVSNSLFWVRVGGWQFGRAQIREVWSRWNAPREQAVLPEMPDEDHFATILGVDDGMYYELGTQTQREAAQFTAQLLARELGL